MTIRIALIVTGDMEKRALGASLHRVFPSADVEWVDTQRTDCFTSCKLGDVPVLRSPSGADSSVTKLANALIAAADPGRKGLSANLAIAVEDLEVCNRLQPERVVKWVRDAVEDALRDDVLREWWPSADRRERCRQRVQERCSFHLFSPMTEAYFFGEVDALARAGAQHSARIDPTSDLESFKTDDKDYLNPTTEHEHKEDPAHHPKEYRRFLCRPGDYKETAGGVDALKLLDWAAVTERREHVLFARSLFADIAEAVGAPSPFPGETHPLTRVRSGGLMRNLP
jgi:hypothetical protein